MVVTYLLILIIGKVGLQFQLTFCAANFIRPSI